MDQPDLHNQLALKLCTGNSYDIEQLLYNGAKPMTRFNDLTEQVQKQVACSILPDRELQHIKEANPFLFHLAVCKGPLDFVRIFYQYGAHDAQDNYGRSVLHYACDRIHELFFAKMAKNL